MLKSWVNFKLNICLQTFANKKCVDRYDISLFRPLFKCFTFYLKKINVGNKGIDIPW